MRDSYGVVVVGVAGVVVCGACCCVVAGAAAVDWVFGPFLQSAVVKPLRQAGSAFQGLRESLPNLSSALRWPSLVRICWIEAFDCSSDCCLAGVTFETSRT